jgi:hypothetical protein
MTATVDENQANKIAAAETIMAMICGLFMELSSDLSREQELRISEIEEHLLRAVGLPYRCDALVRAT